MIAAAMHDVRKAYGARIALAGLNLSVPAGSVYGLVGPNGVGKSTALRILTGVVRPDCGHVQLFETPLDATRPVPKRRISVLLDEQRFPHDVSALEYLVLTAKLFGLPMPERRALELLEKVGLQACTRWPARRLSHGQQQKLGIARALVHDADLYLWDEPVTGLDAYGIRDTRELVQDLRRRGKAVLFCSQILSEVERTADRIGILSAGRLIAEGTLSDLQRRCGIGLRLDVELDQPSGAAVLGIQRLSWVRSVVPDGRLLHVELADDLDHRAELAAAVMAHGGLVVELRARPESLEDLFLRLTAEPPQTQEPHVAG